MKSAIPELTTNASRIATTHLRWTKNQRIPYEIKEKPSFGLFEGTDSIPKYQGFR
jgi:hypothetical protein